MSYQKLAVLVERLIKNTEHGLITWETTETDNVYQISFANYSVRILLSDFDDTVHLQVINDEGNIVEDVRSVELIKFISNCPSKMREMYNSARRQAMGVDTAIDAILKKLPDPDDIPF